MTRLRPLVITALLLGLTGCASAVDPLERLGRKAVESVGDREAGHQERVRAEAARD